MIAQLTGTVSAVGATWAVIDVGGVGIKTLCGPNTTAELRRGQQATLSTSLVVREDSLTLYGFGTAEERDFFELLMTASGVGPKLAQAALAVLTPDDLRQAIATENLVALTKVPGVGRKGAQRIVIELKDKVNAVLSEQPTAGNGPTTTQSAEWREQVSQGLQGLGWSAKDAEAACDRVENLAEDDPSVGVAVLMRAALQTLAKP
ncbi:Holliday junction branch migration protein RuvA [Microlunatus sp. Gsoil 973]|uniref:Holliday junction branch migration protein RuvA n=1 Tax=Microlunatus sp. Gsoil 973 TaxID=2672569 RepID=UPI0012B4BADF|nr:Holliday junction branch migration protein RuvA [Microlunatus sp. Gsoil 973]QGN32703.1 Holliday junction branch migration protein RuvA [Microlunatus sp. Gsoil 973]